MKKRFTEARIVGFLREVDAGILVKALCQKHGFSVGSAASTVNGTLVLRPGAPCHVHPFSVSVHDGTMNLVTRTERFQNQEVERAPENVRTGLRQAWRGGRTSAMVELA